MANSDYYGYGVDGSHGYFNQPDPPECPKCAAPIEEGMEFCPECGTHLDWKELNGEEWW